MIHSRRIKKILLARHILPEKTLDEYLAKAKSQGVNPLDYLVNHKAVTEQQLYSALAADYGLDYIDLQATTIADTVLALLPKTLVQTDTMAVFQNEAATKTIKIATTDPGDLTTLDFIRQTTGLTVLVYLTTKASINNIIRQYHSHLTEALAAFEQPLSSSQHISAVQVAKDIPLLNIVDTVLQYAIFQNASDIEIEPTEHNVTIDFRINGVVRSVITLPKAIQAGVVARIKILANLTLDEHRLPQAGRLTIPNESSQVTLRVSIMPVANGEKISLRIISETNTLLNLEQLGFNALALAAVRRQLAKPQGMLVVAGPTGSGKTTTLYTMLGMFNAAAINISTIENPIEYHLPHLNQSQINLKAGFTFAAALRSLLRQDPNIIMISHLPDGETAELAAHAAMTGHMILSTLHSHDAVSTVLHLRTMAVPNFLIASTINCIIAQRLVRKICQNCITSYHLTPADQAKINQLYDWSEILAGFAKLGETIDPNTDLTELSFFRGAGCDNCFDTGYSGRLGIYEVFEITAAASQIILAGGSKVELRNQAIKDGMVLLTQDAFIKAKHGLTTIEEIIRVATTNADTDK